MPPETLRLAPLGALLLAACATTPPPPDPFVAAMEMRELAVCETSVNRTVCGTWTWDSPNRQFLGRYDNGAAPALKLVRYDGTTFEVMRVDGEGPTAGLTGHYVARRGAGTAFNGSAVFRYKGRSWGGMWEARPAGARGGEGTSPAP